jgi:Xaa-Pro dipeptidase
VTSSPEKVAGLDDALPFAAAEYRDRLVAVRSAMTERGLDALLVTGPENIAYLSGYHTTGYHVFQCLVVPLERDPYFVIRALELGSVESHSCIADAVQVGETDDPVVTLARALRERASGRRVGFDDRGMFLPPATVDALRASHHGELLPGSGVVESCRAVKSPAEIELIREATGVAEQALRAGVAATVADGRTDSDVAAAVIAELTRAGSEYTGSPAYVVAGPAGAVGHATHGRRTLVEGDGVWIELGASLHRYHGALGRTAAIGSPGAALERAADVAAAVLEAMLDAIRPGISSGDADRAGRDVATEAGLGDCWRHRAGYSLGLSFPPGLGEGHVMDIKPGDPRPLLPGMVFHLIPILTVPGVGAAGVTETVLVTEDGVESLVDVPRGLVDAAWAAGDGTVRYLNQGTKEA